MQEQRQLPRWEIKKEAMVWLSEQQGMNYCTIEDMHLKGMRISSAKRLFQQQVVSMAFTVGDSFDLIKIEAQIPWAKEKDGKYIYGLSFNRIDDPDKDRIYDYISTNCFDQFKNKWWASSK